MTDIIDTVDAVDIVQTESDVFAKPAQPTSRRQFLKQGALLAGTALVASSGLSKAFASSSSGQTAQANLPTNHPQIKMHDTVAGGLDLLEQETIDSLKAKDFSHLLGGGVKGLSDDQLSQHFKLYEGYVAKTNQLNTQLANISQQALDSANTSMGEYRDALEARSYTHNGAVLHELYFGNLGWTTDPSTSLRALVDRDFGNWDRFQAQLVAAGKAARGWAVLVLDMRDGHLKIFGMDEHNAFMPAMAYPLLSLDVYEHAYMVDYGIARAKYLDTFIQNINWEAVHKRLMFAVHHLQTGPKVTV